MERSYQFSPPVDIKSGTYHRWCPDRAGSHCLNPVASADGPSGSRCPAVMAEPDLAGDCGTSPPTTARAWTGSDRSEAGSMWKTLIRKSFTWVQLNKYCTWLFYSWIANRNQLVFKPNLSAKFCGVNILYRTAAIGVQEWWKVKSRFLCFWLLEKTVVCWQVLAVQLSGHTGRTYFNGCHSPLCFLKAYMLLEQTNDSLWVTSSSTAEAESLSASLVRQGKALKTVSTEMHRP